jgi:putative FmdB family regulatory protein
MPTYSYACDACGGSFELEQRISEDPIKKCSLCGKPQAKRQIVSGNFILKGGGWYSDGYGNKKTGSTKSESSKSESSKSESKAESKSESKDSKSETKAEAKPATSSTKSEAKANAAE